MPVPTLGKKLYAMLMFLVVSVVGGILAAGLAVPTAGVAAELARRSAEAVESIPAEFETPPLAEGSKVLLQDGTVLTNFYDENRVYVPLENIAPVMRQAQVSVEDHRFYAHGALDLKGTLRALVRTSSGNTQGGSSLTQQYVKLVLLDKAVKDDDKEGIAAAQNRTFSRKMLELRYAIALEQKLSKDQILERYLNLAYFGDRSYGVEAAAHHYFNTTAKNLTLPQAAMLAGLVRNPATTDPVRNEKLAIDRRNTVLDIMASVVDPITNKTPITKEQAVEAKKVGFDRTLVQPIKHGCIASQFPHLCSIVELTLVKTMTSLGPDEETRRNLLNRGGLTITTMIDPRTQDAAQKAVSDFVHATDPVIATMVIIEPGTGLIKAAAQSRPNIGTAPGETFWNYTMDSIRGGAEGYFGGSTFKAFTIAAAIEKGFPTTKGFDSPSKMDFRGEVFRTCEGSVKVPKPWEVNTGGTAFHDMYSGARASSNTYFVQLEQAVGLCEVTNMAKKVGLRLSDPKLDLVKDYQVPAFTLGTAEITPLSLANAYATFAARGLRCDPIIIKSATGKDGKNYEVPSANCQQVIDQKVADAVNDVLREPFKGGTAAAANIPGYNLAGKTGTDTNAPTVWLVGYTPQLSGAAMITVDKTADRYKRLPNDRRSLEGAPVRGGKAGLRGSSGGEAGAGIWKPAMAVALQGLPRGDFVAPSAAQTQGEMIDIPSCNGQSMNDCRATLQAAGFSTTIVRQVNDKPAGTWLGTTPRGRAPRYGTVRFIVSSGPALPPSPEEQVPAPEPAPAPQPAPGKPPRKP